MLQTDTPRPSIETSRPQETVLLAEDEQAVRHTLRVSLQRAGFHVLEAENGNQALALCLGHAGVIDLVVADALIVPVGVRQLIEQVTRLRPLARMLCISGYPRDVLLEEGLLTPDIEFLQKPFTATVLTQKVSELLIR